MVVLDTSALIYWTLVPGTLSEHATTAIAAAEAVVISSISIWEIGLKVKRGKLELPLTPAEFVVKLEATDRVRIEPVTSAIWLRSVDLEWEHKDPADRTIVATASLLHCPLVTADLEIQAFYPAALW
ncbi:MAG TPA: type II toxin-antitoxin system VapC family toxin [Hyphomonas sp.]|nr:type II toxin-antitoxin system VapC family toxin [Hyphomonas sp.]